MTWHRTWQKELMPRTTVCRVRVVSKTGKGNSLCTQDRHFHPKLQGLFPAEGSVFHPPHLGSDGTLFQDKGALEVSSFLVPSKRSALVTTVLALWWGSMTKATYKIKGSILLGLRLQFQRTGACLTIMVGNVVAGRQAFKCMSLWGAFSFEPLQVPSCLLLGRGNLAFILCFHNRNPGIRRKYVRGV